MNKLLEEYAKSVLNFSIEYNPHKMLYQSVSEYIENQELIEDDFPNKDMQLCIENNTIWSLHCYPRTPIGFYDIYGHDLETLLDILKNNIQFENIMKDIF